MFHDKHEFVFISGSYVIKRAERCGGSAIVTTDDETGKSSKTGYMERQEANLKGMIGKGWEKVEGRWEEWGQEGNHIA